MSFVHLHNRTQYTLLDGAMSPKALLQRTAEMEMPSVAVTDSCNLYCAVELYKSAKKYNVKPIYGAEIWLWPPGLKNLKQDDPDSGYQLVFLIENKIGYKNLCHLITTAIFDGMHYRPRIDFELLEKHNEGLIALSSGLNGPVGRALQTPTPEDYATEALNRIGGIFGKDRLYLEMQDYGLDNQTKMNEMCRSLSKKFDLPTVITNDCRYVEKYDVVTLDLLNCIARGQNIDNPDREMLQTDQQYIKSPEEMAELFPNDKAALDITLEIAERCNFKFQTDTYWFPATDPPDPNPPLPEGVKMDDPAYRVDTQANWEYFYRAYPPPKDFNMPDPEKEAIPKAIENAGNLCGYFEWYCEEGLKIRLKRVEKEKHEEYWERLKHEIKIIEQMGFPAYMLIVAEFINWSKDNHIPVGPGRGSAAGSLVSFSMGITDIDPMEFGLLFERFLNPERVSMPDIDVDFCQDRREEAIEHVRVKYGKELVSQIITYGKLQAKAAIKDVSRSLGIEFRAANDIAKLVPDELNITLDKALADPKLKAYANCSPLVKRVMTLAKRVEGMTRQTGVHAAGVVIADRPLVEHSPLYRDGPEGGPVVQYDMKSAESIGLIKFDFLGLKTLDQIRDAVEMIARNTGETIDISAIDLEDKKVYDMLCQGDSMGVFQVESAGMKRLLKRLKPNCIDDLIAILALYRPGPLSSGMVDSFIKCKHGEQEISYPHPKLEPILKSTYGSIVYQEQVMQIAQDLSGYSLGEADLLRRAMGKKKVEAMAEQKVRFIKGAVERKIEQQTADDIFELMAYFAGYGFNKSHSAAYGMVSYQTAWLKANHRSEYLAALMTIESGNSDKILMYITDCKRARLEILPPNVNKSMWYFDVLKNNRNQIRFGLGAVKSIGSNAVKAIVEAREKDGEFKSFINCLERIDYKRVNKKVLENLIKCGAFDWTKEKRREMLEGLPMAMAEAQRVQADKAAGQMSLFGAFATTMKVPELTLPAVGEWQISQKLTYEHEALGLFITGHPLDAFTDVEKKDRFVSLIDIASCPDHAEVSVAGIISERKIITRSNGSRIGIITLEDRTDSIECTLRNKALDKYERDIRTKSPVKIVGKIDRWSGESTIKVNSLIELAEIREQKSNSIDIKLNLDEIKSDKIEALHEIIQSNPGKSQITFYVSNPDKGFARLSCPHKISLSETLIHKVENLFQRADVIHIV